MFKIHTPTNFSGKQDTILYPLFRRTPFSFLVLVLFLFTACQQAPQAGECDPHVIWSQEPDGDLLLRIDPKNCLAGVTATATPLVVTDIPAPTSTALPTATSLPPTVTVTVPQPVLQNPSFETKPPFGAVKPQYGLPEINLVPGWTAYFCGIPYTSQNCAVPLAWNPYQPYMRRSEYKPANPDQDCLNANQYANRVKKGCNAQQWFSYSGVSNGGVYQSVNTLVVGVRYELSAYMQLWSAENAAGGCVARDTQNKCTDRNADPYTSDLATLDDRTSIFARIGVDTSCGTNAYAQSVIWSRDFGYDDGLYDKYGQIKIAFVAQSTCATLFIGGYNRFSKTHSDFFVDDAKLVIIP